MLTLLFAILLTLTESGKVSTYRRRRLLQNAAVPLPTATEAAGNGAGAGAGSGAGSGATEMECILSNKDPAVCAGRTTNMVNPQQNFKLKCSANGSSASST
eukprot:94927_1